MAYRPFPSYWMFRDRSGKWRWNFASAAGKVIALSSVAYFHKEGCIRAIQMIKGSSDVPVWGPKHDVHIVTEEPAISEPGRELEMADAE